MLKNAVFRRCLTYVEKYNITRKTAEKTPPTHKISYFDVTSGSIYLV